MSHVKSYEHRYHHGVGTYRVWGRHIAAGSPVILSHRRTTILQMADLRQHCQIMKYEEIRLLPTKGVEPVEICS